MRKFLATNLERAPGGGWRWQINLRAITAALRELERSPLAAGDRFEGPTLFIAGGESDQGVPDERALIRAHFPSARITAIPGSGHNPHIEAREAFVKAVLSAL